TLNVLLSFAQFEREVTGERIRDKIAASKKKGMWMGGNVPLGYDANERTLVINPAEAPRPVIEAAARNPEQRALPAYGQPRFRRNHRPPLSNREMAGCPARKSRSTCSWPILRCRSSITFCASATAGALLPRANSSPARV